MKITCVHQLMSKYFYPKEYFPTIKRKEIYMQMYGHLDNLLLRDQTQ